MTVDEFKEGGVQSSQAIMFGGVLSLFMRAGVLMMHASRKEGEDGRVEARQGQGGHRTAPCREGWRQQ